MNKTTTPFFSIVYPTKDRPFLIDYCINSCLLQTFHDFELIICDNSSDFKTKKIVDMYRGDDRLKYFRSKNKLSMGDNWEFALDKAIGKYITVLTDKTILYITSLQKAFDYLKKNPVDVLNWRNDEYYLTNELPNQKIGYDKGFYVKLYEPVPPKEIDKSLEILRNFQMASRRGSEGEKYFWAKICFGFYSCSLIRRIKKNEKSVFHGISPDYSSKFRALTYADKIVDIGQAFQLSIQTRISNGGKNSRYANNSKEFIKTYGEEDFLSKLPIPNLYASLHNAVAFDFFSSSRTKHFVLNKKKLIVRCFEDLFETSFISLKEKKRQYDLLFEQISYLTLISKIYVYSSYFYFLMYKFYIKIRLILGKIKRRFYNPSKKIYSSVIELITSID